MHESCRRHAWPEAFRSVRIVKSSLKNESGSLGALALMFEKLDEEI